MVILPLGFAQDECARQGLDLHVSNVSIANKPGAEPAIGRLISDYSHSEGASMMFGGKKEINKLLDSDQEPDGGGCMSAACQRSGGVSG